MTCIGEESGVLNKRIHYKQCGHTWLSSSMTTEHKRDVKEIPLGFRIKVLLYYHHHRVITTPLIGGPHYTATDQYRMRSADPAQSAQGAFYASYRCDTAPDSLSKSSAMALSSPSSLASTLHSYPFSRHCYGQKETP